MAVQVADRQFVQFALHAHAVRARKRFGHAHAAFVHEARRAVAHQIEHREHKAHPADKSDIETARDHERGNAVRDGAGDGRRECEADLRGDDRCEAHGEQTLHGAEVRQHPPEGKSAFLGGNNLRLTLRHGPHPLRAGSTGSRRSRDIPRKTPAAPRGRPHPPRGRCRAR